MKKLIFIFSLLALAAFGQFFNLNSPTFLASLGGGSTLKTGLLSYWKLDEESGTRADLVGSHSLLDNNNDTGAATGIINQAANLTGLSTGYLYTADYSAVDFSGGYTFAFWSYISSATAAGGVQMAFSENNSYIAIFQQNNQSLVGQNIINQVYSNDTWYHFVVTKTADGVIKLYRDGVLIDSQTSSPISFTADSNLTFGNYIAPDPSYAGTGLIDECGFWNRVLSATEVAALYNGGAGLPFSNF